MHSAQRATPVGKEALLQNGRRIEHKNCNPSIELISIRQNDGGGKHNEVTAENDGSGSLIVTGDRAGWL